MTEAIGYCRQSEDDPRVITGFIPYGAVSNLTNLDGLGDIGRETLRPGCARESVGVWMDAQAKDGRKMPYRPRHKERPNGTVTMLRDTEDGVQFAARIFPGPRGDEYLNEVQSGLNAVSPEFAPVTPPKRLRSGLVVQEKIKLMGIAGSDMPAYDGARIALRDMEDMDVAQPTQPEATTSAIPEPTIAERDAQERAAASAIVPERSTIVVTRPEAVYSPREELNWLQDNWRAAKGDYAARERQDRHGQMLHDRAVRMEREAQARMMDPAYAERAGDLLLSEIPGALPTDFVPGLLTPRILKGRPMASFYSHYPISDARPRTFAKVTTSSTVAVTATPLLYGATIDVSRAVLDSADPSALSIVYQDLIEAYGQASETVVKTAVEAGSTASGVAITAATPYAGTLANVINHYAVRFRSATGAFIPSALFSVLAAQGDSGTGRPFLPMIGAQNSDGQTVSDDTSLALAVLSAKSYLSYASTTNVCVFGRPTDFVVYESPIVQVQYDQVVGPQAVRVGLYAYLVVGARLGSLKVTAA